MGLCEMVCAHPRAGLFWSTLLRVDFLGRSARQWLVLGRVARSSNGAGDTGFVSVVATIFYKAGTLFRPRCSKCSSSSPLLDSTCFHHLIRVAAEVEGPGDAYGAAASSLPAYFVNWATPDACHLGTAKSRKLPSQIAPISLIVPPQPHTAFQLRTPPPHLATRPLRPCNTAWAASLQPIRTTSCRHRHQRSD